MSDNRICLQCNQPSRDGKKHDHNKSVFCSLERFDWDKLKLVRHPKKKSGRG